MQQPAQYTAPEVAQLFRVDASTVRRWAEKRQIPAIKTPGGVYRFPKPDIDQMLSISVDSTPEPVEAATP